MSNANVLVDDDDRILLLQVPEEMHALGEMLHDDQLAAHVVLDALLGVVEEAGAEPAAADDHVAQLVQQLEDEPVFLLSHRQHVEAVAGGDGHQRAVLRPEHVLESTSLPVPTVGVTSIFLITSPDCHA